MTNREDRKRQLTSQRREQILEAALFVFSQHGYDRATIPDVARQAGVAVGTIYNYYPSKRDLLVAITNKYIIEPFTEILKQPKTASDAAYIAAIMKNRLNFGLENLGKFLPLFAEVQRDAELRHGYSEHVLKPVMNMMEKYVASRVREGAFRDVNPAFVTRAIGGMVIGFLLLYRIEGESSPIHKINQENLANEMTKLVLKGLQRE